MQYVVQASQILLYIHHILHDVIKPIVRVDGEEKHVQRRMWGGVAKWVAHPTRSRWMPVNCDKQRFPLFP